MNEQVLVPDAFPGAPAGGIPGESQQSIGQYLRAAREERGLSLPEVAGLLKLTQRQVEAIEGDDWQRLPGQTFARGFLRNYARLLQLDGDMLLAHLEASMAPEPVNIELARTASGELPRPGYAKRRDLVAVFGAAGMVLVALGIYFLVPDDFWATTVEPLLASQPAAPAGDDKPSGDGGAAQSTPLATTSEAPKVGSTDNEAPSAVSAALPTEQAVTPASSAVPAEPVPDKAPPAGTPSGAAAAAVDPVAAPTPAAQGAITPPGKGKLSFEFAKSAWVEVKDKTGQTLLSQLQPAGSQKELAGTPPFTLVVGNASNVKVFFNGKPVLLTPNEVSNVARTSVQ